MLNKKWFTLVELIVVVTILAILSTIAYMSYTSYMITVRDTGRISQLKSISEWLQSLNINKTLPLPDDYVEVRVNGKVIWYQWYAWKDVLNAIWYSEEWKDVKIKNYFSYYLTKNRRYYQLMSFIENQDSLSSNLLLWNTYAYDYSNLYVWVTWNKLWILTDEFNTPIQEVPSIKTATYIDLATTDANKVFNAHIENNRTYTFSGSILASRLETLSDPWKYWPPKYCPEWFVWSWWDAWFNQKWFCVAKYEMWYADEAGAVLNDRNDSSTGAVDFYTYKYDSSKKIISAKWRYPISQIDYSEARSACENLWKWFHLITNNEWMSLARDIEFLQENWSSWKIGEWFLTSWLSDDDSDPRRCFEWWWDPYYQYKTWEWDPNCNKKRQHKLFSWEYIWDLAWWIWEIVDKW